MRVKISQRDMRREKEVSPNTTETSVTPFPNDKLSGSPHPLSLKERSKLELQTDKMIHGDFFAVKTLQYAFIPSRHVCPASAGATGSQPGFATVSEQCLQSAKLKRVDWEPTS